MKAGPAPDQTSFPVFVKPEDEKKCLSHKDNFYVDTFERQLKELFIIKNPQYVGMDKKEVFASQDFLAFQKKYKNKYRLVFYPWNKHLVKIVQKKDYYELKTNRNKDLITQTEQEKLRRYKVAVLGMSVGSNIALVMTQAGIANEIILADFDELDTTNLNRIIAGVHQVGINKTVIAARRIYEDNPYAEVTPLTGGISKQILEKLLRAKKIDCIIEEIDNMPLKIQIRKLAKKYKIPVLMITDNGDQVVLTIERFDLGYKKFFEKPVDYWDRRIASFESKGDFADIVINDIVGGARLVDPRMLKSAKRVVAHELVSWPQLGSASLLGGVIVTIAIKKMLTGEEKNLFRREHVSLL